MAKSPSGTMPLILLTILLILAVASLDFFVRLGVATGVAYVGAIFVARRSRIPRFAWSMAGVCTCLIFLGLAFSPPGGETWQVLANRFLSVFVVWLVALMPVGKPAPVSNFTEPMTGSRSERFWIYVGVTVVLTGLAVALQFATWKSSARVHTVMEVVATTVALTVGVVALTRYYSHKDYRFLFIGTGFFGTALLDAYHAFVTSNYFIDRFPSPAPTLLPWSWFASRIYLAALMLLSWWMSRNTETDDGEAVPIREGVAFASVATMTIVSFCFFAFVPLPTAYFPNAFFGRPFDLLAALLFGVAFLGYLRTGLWQRDIFVHWVLISLAIGVVAQAIVMARSFALYDAMFDFAHVLKIASYSAVLVGMLASIYQLYLRSQRDAEQLRESERALLREVEKHRRTEKLLRRSNADLQQFAYAASHDLREPLRAVASFCELLEKHYGAEFDERGKEFLFFAIDGAKRMQDLIDNLLEYSRVETRGQPLVPVEANLLVNKAKLDLRLVLEEKGAVVDVGDLPRISVDSAQMARVFQNLIGNAVKFCEGQPEVRIDAKRKRRDWVFSVRDNGIGIDPQYNERIFTIFQRLHTREEYPGTGVGLAICKRIIDRHGGHIWVESELGQGSTFFFSLPALEDEDAVLGNEAV